MLLTSDHKFDTNDMGSHGDTYTLQFLWFPPDDMSFSTVW